MAWSGGEGGAIRRQGVFPGPGASRREGALRGRPCRLSRCEPGGPAAVPQRSHGHLWPVTSPITLAPMGPRSPCTPSLGAITLAHAGSLPALQDPGQGGEGGARIGVVPSGTLPCPRIPCSLGAPPGGLWPGRPLSAIASSWHETVSPCVFRRGVATGIARLAPSSQERPLRPATGICGSGHRLDLRRWGSGRGGAPGGSGGWRSRRRSGLAGDGSRSRRSPPLGGGRPRDRSRCTPGPVRTAPRL